MKRNLAILFSLVVFGLQPLWAQHPDEENCVYVPATELTMTDVTHETSVGGVHPGDYGYTIWARSIEKSICKILKKYGIK